MSYLFDERKREDGDLIVKTERQPIPASQKRRPWALGHKTFDLSLTFTRYIPYKKVRRRSKMSSSKYYGPGARPHDHKLRKYLSRKLDSSYLDFFLTKFFNKLHI